MKSIETSAEDGGAPIRSTLSKVVETGFLVLTWMALSTYTEIYGPTLIDLKLKLNTDYENVAVAVSGRSVGWFPGSIAGGFLVDRFPGYCYLMLGIVLDIAAGVTAAIPWSPSTTYMWIFCFVGGSMESILNIAGTRILFNIWGSRAVSPLMLIHLGYGIGSFIAPLYCNPFLAEKTSNSNNTANSLPIASNSTISGTTNSQINNTSREDNETLKDDSKIEYAYAISAAIAVTVSVAFYTYQIKESFTRTSSAKVKLEKGEEDKRQEEEQNKESTKKKSLKEMINPAYCAKGRFCYGAQILFFLFFYFGNIAGGDRVIGSFIRSYAVDELKFEKDDASFLNTAYWISFSVGRLLFSIISLRISVRILIIVEAGGMAATAILLTIFADEYVLSLWILILFFAFFASATWPTGVAWTDYHLELTGLAMTWQILGASVGGIVHLRLIGYLYEHHGPITFLYQIMGYGIFQFVLSVVLDIIGAQHGNRFLNEIGNIGKEK